MLLSGHIRAGRAILRISQEELAKISGVSVVTIKRLESEDEEIAANYSTIKKIKKLIASIYLMIFQLNQVIFKLLLLQIKVSNLYLFLILKFHGLQLLKNQNLLKMEMMNQMNQTNNIKSLKN